MPKSDFNKEKLEDGKKMASGYARYSGIAIQMIVTLLLAYYAGNWLDERYSSGTPWFTVVFILVGLILALWLPLRSLLKS